MKVFVLSLFALGTVTATAWGQGSQVIIRERAKALTNPNNAPTGVPPAAQPARPNAAPAPDPVLNATLQNIAGIQLDLARLETNAAVKAQLIANLNAAPQGKKPSAGSISKFADDLATALAGRKVPSDQRKTLAQYCRAINNGSYLSPAQEEAIFDGAQKILQTAQVPAGDAAKIIADMKVIVRESK